MREEEVRKVVGAAMGRCLQHLVKGKTRTQAMGVWTWDCACAHVCARLCSRKRFERTRTNLKGVFCRVAWEAGGKGSFTFLLCVFLQSELLTIGRNYFCK